MGISLPRLKAVISCSLKSKPRLDSIYDRMFQCRSIDLPSLIVTAVMDPTGAKSKSHLQCEYGLRHPWMEAAKRKEENRLGWAWEW